MQIRVEIKGVKRLQSTISTIPLWLRYEIDDLLEGFNEQLGKELRKYPPPPPQSKYIRTGRLGRGWGVDIQRSRLNVSAISSNRVPYAPFVMGDNQLPHFSHWRTASSIISTRLRDLETRLDRAARSLEQRMSRSSGSFLSRAGIAIGNIARNISSFIRRRFRR